MMPRSMLILSVSAVGIAVSCGNPVGLDVEAADRHTKTDVLKLAKRRFAPAELASLEGKKPPALHVAT